MLKLLLQSRFKQVTNFNRGLLLPVIFLTLKNLDMQAINSAFIQTSGVIASPVKKLDRAPLIKKLLKKASVEKCMFGFYYQYAICSKCHKTQKIELDALPYKCHKCSGTMYPLFYLLNIG
jgi:hypothetical protein